MCQIGRVGHIAVKLFSGKRNSCTKAANIARKEQSIRWAASIWIGCTEMVIELAEDAVSREYTAEESLSYIVDELGTWSLRGLAKELTNRGLRSQKGKGLQHTTIKRALKRLDEEIKSEIICKLQSRFKDRTAEQLASVIESSLFKNLKV